MARLGRQELGFVVRGPIFPHPEQNPDPAIGQGPQGGMVAVAPGPVRIIIGAGPTAAAQGGEGQLMQGLAEVLVAGAAQMDAAQLTALVDHRTRARQGLHRLCRCKPVPVLPPRGHKAGTGQGTDPRHAHPAVRIRVRQ